MRKLEVLLIHLPRKSKIIPRITLMPMGIFAIADYLDSNGTPVQIIHEGLEKQINPKFSLLRYVRKNNIHICAFALHWHQQARRVIQMARKLKAKIPQMTIIIGGVTASIFADEILEKHPEIDFVIKGDSEIPMHQLCTALQADKLDILPTIPNLMWRSAKGEIQKNDDYQLDNTQVREISFTNFKLLKNYRRYLSFRHNQPLICGQKAFSFSAGRGCNAGCPYCAGSRRAEQKYYNRTKVQLFPHGYVIRQLEGMIQNGVHTWNSCFDPDPKSDYYIKLFREIRKKDLTITHFFDCFGLPTKQFLDEFRKTFTKKSAINISPETGSDELRKKIRTFYYTNKELLEILAYIIRQRMNCSVYFSTGLPFEKKEDLLQSFKLIDTIRNKFPKVRIYSGVIDLEPGSALFDYQSRLGVRSKIRNFETLLEVQKKTLEVNYSTREFSRRQIEKHCDLLKIEAQCRKKKSFFFTRFL